MTYICPHCNNNLNDTENEYEEATVGAMGGRPNPPHYTCPNCKNCIACEKKQP